MIELIFAKDDDRGFLSHVQRIMNGATTRLQASEVFLVHVDNWFDHKWLGWWSTWKHKELKELYVPCFNPNRVRSQKHFVFDAASSRWTLLGPGKPLHVGQPGRRPAYAQQLNQVCQSAAFIWYSGNTITNRAGSMMLYLSGAECYAWYASFRKDEDWTIADEFGITRHELISFEELGRQMEAVQS